MPSSSGDVSALGIVVGNRQVSALELLLDECCWMNCCWMNVGNLPWELLLVIVSAAVYVWQSQGAKPTGHYRSDVKRERDCSEMVSYSHFSMPKLGGVRFFSPRKSDVLGANTVMNAEKESMGFV